MSGAECTAYLRTWFKLVCRNESGDSSTLHHTRVNSHPSCFYLTRQKYSVYLSSGSCDLPEYMKRDSSVCFVSVCFQKEYACVGVCVYFYWNICKPPSKHRLCFFLFFFKVILFLWGYSFFLSFLLVFF